MADADVENVTAPPTNRRRFGSPNGRALIALFTTAGLFMFSGIVAHSHAPPTYPCLAHAGWILAGLAPLIGYVSYLLLARRAKSPRDRWACAAIGVAIYALCCVLGVWALHLGLHLPGPIAGSGIPQ